MLGILSAEIMIRVSSSGLAEPVRVVRSSKSNSARSDVPYAVSAPFGPTAFGRWKIQFCHAVRRPKIFVSSVSGPTKRRFASMPVSASGDSAARLSIARRTSSSQSISSGAKVTRPASSASCGIERPVVRRARLPTLCRVAVEARLQPRQAVAHRVRPGVHARELDGVRPFGIVQHVRAIGGERQLEQRAGERVAGLDDARRSCAPRDRGASACA